MGTGVRGFVGLGSNLGDRRAHLAGALARMSRADVDLLAVSSVWETEPADGAAGGWFLNAVARFHSRLAPPELLDLFQRIEREAGRVRVRRNEPRTLDLDLLLVDGLAWRDRRLHLPHPRMWRRRFVLEPLVEIAPGLREPASGRTAAEIAGARAGDGPEVRRAGRLAAVDGLSL